MSGTGAAIISMWCVPLIIGKTSRAMGRCPPISPSLAVDVLKWVEVHSLPAAQYQVLPFWYHLPTVERLST